MEEQNLTNFFRFEDLRIYNKSLDYYDWLINKVKDIDEFNRKILMVPFLDTAAKISIQIADGSAMPKTEFIEYLKYAKGLIRQCVVFTTMAQHNQIFTEQDVEQSRITLIEMTKMLGAMIVSFQRSAHKKNGRFKPKKEEATEEFSAVDLEFNY
ncbi:MAG: four helix bundle protein [Bacteroidota bacterium]|nr:four helix bundle protein [Bacteroidota bacterium]